ncbi:Uncharacterised protein [Arcanobacterium haemolyticum]|nr:YwiC-like family protein [Arcanobacterium haemolyticum]SPT75559.1 Uncharacterised protein [Arcanobacterium haemolyticum]
MVAEWQEGAFLATGGCVYGSVCGAGCGFGVVGSVLLVWVAVFAPLVGITFWQSAVRADRSMLNDTVTVAAASLMLPVAAHVGHVSGWSRVWIVTILVFAYFLGTVFYVKTNIRKRSSSVWLGLSVAWHVCGLIFACVCCGFDAGASVSFWHCVVWGCLWCVLWLFRYGARGMAGCLRKLWA